MLKNNGLIINGLKQLKDLEKGLIPKTEPEYKNTSKKYKNKIDFSELLSLKKNINTNHDDFQDHDDMDSDFDEILIPDQDDIFDKKEIKVNISSNDTLFNTFPNALLLEESILNTSEKNTDNEYSEKIVEEKKIKKKIFGILLIKLKMNLNHWTH